MDATTALICPFCDQPVPWDAPYFRGIRGWEEPRKQGGANKITLREETGERAHKACVWLRQHGHIFGQESLL